MRFLQTDGKNQFNHQPKPGESARKGLLREAARGSMFNLRGATDKQTSGGTPQIKYFSTTDITKGEEDTLVKLDQYVAFCLACKTSCVAESYQRL